MPLLNIKTLDAAMVYLFEAVKHFREDFGLPKVLFDRIVEQIAP
jgi:hypothetical protein